MSKSIRTTRIVVAVLATIVLASFQFGVLTAHAASSVFTVDSVGDGADSSPGDGLCDDGAGHCTLRAAIQESNASAGRDTIGFDIGAGGVQTISPNSPLPTVSDPITIDGTTQPGFSDEPVIELEGSSAGNGTNGLSITGGNSTVRGLVINRFGGAGIAGSAIFLAGEGNNAIEGDFLGTDVAGTAAMSNTGAGVFIDGSAGNLIGGTTASARNVISGNTIGGGVHIEGEGATGNLVEGNFIGTDVTGTIHLVNGGQADVEIDGAPDNVVGGTSPGAGNLISGNNSMHVSIHGVGASGNLVLGNDIGTDVTGTLALGNQSAEGVDLSFDASGNTVGGTSPDARNLISGNATGVSVRTDANVVEGNFIGSDITGTTPLGNVAGVVVSDGLDNIIGGVTPGARNLISGNVNLGLWLVGGATGTVVEGNLIGTDANGTHDLGNGGNGVQVQAVSDNIIGGPSPAAANTIAFNGADGVSIFASGTGNAVRGNSIFSNGLLGVDLQGGLDDPGVVTPNDSGDPDTGPNDFQNFPVLASVTGGSTPTVSGSLNSTPNASFDLDFYSSASCDPSGHGEGATFLGSASVSTNSSGDATFSHTFGSVLSGGFLTATATDTAGNTSEFSRCLQFTLPTADLSLVNSGSPDPVMVGANLAFQLTMTNAGPDTASGITLTDNLPGGVSLISATAGQGSCSGNTMVTCSLGSVGKGFEATVNIVVTPTAAGTITNSASVTSAVSDPNPANNQAQATTTVIPATADLSVTVTDFPDPAVLGGTLTYAVRLQNHGPGSAATVSVQDPLPGATTFQSLSVPAGWLCTTPQVGSTGTVSCSKASVGAQEAATFTIAVKVDPSASGSFLTNAATATSATTDPTPANNSAQATTGLQAVGADLSVHTSASPHPVTAGKKLTYTIRVRDLGPDAAQGVVMTDHLPAMTTFLSVHAPSGWSCSTPQVGDRGWVRCTRNFLASGAVARLVLVVQVGSRAPAGALITNKATVHSELTDPKSANNSDSASTRVRHPASAGTGAGPRSI